MVVRILTIPMSGDILNNADNPIIKINKITKGG